MKSTIYSCWHIRLQAPRDVARTDARPTTFLWPRKGDSTGNDRMRNLPRGWNAATEGRAGNRRSFSRPWK